MFPDESSIAKPKNFSYFTVVSRFLVPFAHCNHSGDYSIETAEPRVLIAIGIHMSSTVPVL